MHLPAHSLRDEHTTKTHQHLSNLYQAVLEITADDPLNKNLAFNNAEVRKTAKEQKKSVCDSDSAHTICTAKKRLEGIEREISDFPNSVRQDVRIEVLRYLSYCAARALETNVQKIYTTTAEGIYEKRQIEVGIDKKLYRRKYYWIDYSQLVAKVQQGENDYEQESMRYFNRLHRNLVTEGEFLMIKLLQHANLISNSRKKDFWQFLVGRAKAS